ncbi:MAG: hypothetical protein HY042_01390 [Spirochaetia bacterium]|nr:hypothetical protein [Spirochaetia bacterium]
MTDHAYFRPVILVFSLFALLQFATGAVLYTAKIGFHPGQTIEYYKGSEAARRLYPEQDDHFMQARTFAGMAKAAVGHSMAYALICFLITHLLRSLTARTPALHRADKLALAFYAFAFLDLFAGFFVRFGPLAPWTAVARSVVFVGFEVSGILSVLWLASIAIGSRKPAPNESKVQQARVFDEKLGTANS